MTLFAGWAAVCAVVVLALYVVVGFACSVLGALEDE